MHPRFLSTRNILNLFGQGSIIGMLALGMTIVIIVGSFDISFAHVAAFAACLCVRLVGEEGITPGLGMNLYLAWVLAVGTGIGFCLLDAVNIVYVRVPGIIVSFGMMGVLLGLSLWITDGSLLYYPAMPDGFGAIGRTLIKGVIPPPEIFFIVASLFMVFLLEVTYIGQRLYAVGINFEAARRVGINVNRMKFLAFAVMGALAGVSGIVMASMFGAGNPVMAEGFLFPAIIAVFLGAVFLREGRPNVLGTVTATMLIAIVANGLTLMGYPLYVKEIGHGLVLLGSVVLVCWLKKGGIPGVPMG